MKITKKYKQKAKIPAPTKKNPDRMVEGHIDVSDVMTDEDAFFFLLRMMEDSMLTTQKLIAAYLTKNSAKIEDVIVESFGEHLAVEEWVSSERCFREVKYSVEF